MKCLSVAQPWAWAIMHGGKNVENRVWHRAFTGTILLHASKSRKWFCRGYQGLMPNLPAIAALPYGAIVGTVRITGCIDLEEDRASLWPQLRENVWAFGPYCFTLAEPRPFVTPIPWSGNIAFFDVDLNLLCHAAVQADQEYIASLISA